MLFYIVGNLLQYVLPGFTDIAVYFLVKTLVNRVVG
jgi:hypothetical protein